MPSLKDLRGRISSVSATCKITRAMQMVAAAKLRKSRLAAESARPYAERMMEIVQGLASGMVSSDSAPPLMVGTGRDQVHLLVVCTADRGLCGGFNSSIVRLAKRHAGKLLSEGKEVQFLYVGRKGKEQMWRSFPSEPLGSWSLSSEDLSGFPLACSVGEKIVTLFAEGRFDICTLFFSQFHSAMVQEPVAQQIVPLPLGSGKEKVDPGQDPDRTSSATSHRSEEGARAVHIYEPGEEEILSFLLPRNMSVQLYRALLENGASEQGARMTAMDSATRNAGSMIDRLTLQYNRQRQAQITKELIEIVSGAEAL